MIDNLIDDMAKGYTIFRAYSSLKNFTSVSGVATCTCRPTSAMETPDYRLVTVKQISRKIIPMIWSKEQVHEKTSAKTIIQSSHRIGCLMSLLARSRPHKPRAETHIMATETLRSKGPLSAFKSNGPPVSMYILVVSPGIILRAPASESFGHNQGLSRRKR